MKISIVGRNLINRRLLNNNMIEIDVDILKKIEPNIEFQTQTQTMLVVLMIDMEHQKILNYLELKLILRLVMI
jgi:hypothetical protein